MKDRIVEVIYSKKLNSLGISSFFKPPSFQENWRGLTFCVFTFQGPWRPQYVLKYSIYGAMINLAPDSVD